MRFEGLSSNFELGDHPEDAEISQRIDNVMNSILKQGERVSPFIIEYFQDPDLFHSLPDSLRNDNKKLEALILNMGKFRDIITSERQKRWNEGSSGLLGDEIRINETSHSDGRVRDAESGYKINLDYLRTQGIDPSQVLFFRITQPTDSPKPEYYWTSDYFETRKGLTREISPEKRKTAIILVASLEVINNNGGLIQDINDDDGLSVRQIGTANFDQKLALTKIKPSL